MSDVVPPPFGAPQEHWTCAGVPLKAQRHTTEGPGKKNDLCLKRERAKEGEIHIYMYIMYVYIYICMYHRAKKKWSALFEKKNGLLKVILVSSWQLITSPYRPFTIPSFNDLAWYLWGPPTCQVGRCSNVKKRIHDVQSTVSMMKMLRKLSKK